MQPDNIKTKSINGTLWSLADNITTQGLTFIIGIILARLLSPTDYGMIGALSIFMVMAGVIIECGFGKALIRKKERTQADLSTAFYFNIAVGVISYLVLFVASPLISSFFREPALTPILRVMAASLILNSFGIVQNSILTARLDIRTQAVINVITQIPMGLAGIWFAYNGYGVWALVIQHTGSALLRTLLLWICSPWRPSLIFDRASFSYLFNFGWKLLGANIIGTFFNEIYTFIIGRTLGSADLGLYTKAKSLSQKPLDILKSIINRVALPVMVETGGDRARIQSVYSRLIRLISFISFPLTISLITIARPLIMLLWGDTWADTIPLFCLFCIGFAWAPISTINFSLMELMNRTDLTLKLEFVKKPILVISILLSMPYGLSGIVAGSSLYLIVAGLINMSATRRLLDYSYRRQLADILPYFAIATITMLAGLYAASFIDNQYAQIATGLSINAILYPAICAILKTKGFNETKSLIRSIPIGKRIKNSVVRLK